VRLHRLEVTAFGPFPDPQVIDFDALTAAGLFLIHGQTGAGKTSILDAVCFALYGRVPGARGAVRNLRSDHAGPDRAPRVLLETTIRGRRFRITRSPAWERPKRRGSGSTTEPARVIMEEYERDGWTALTTRLDEAGDLVLRLLGMNIDQFCQVALLPQGEFATFLRAGAEERRKVLERLFATEVYTQVEKWLAERRAATRREADELRAHAESCADRIAEVAGTDRPRGTEDTGEPIEALPLWAAELTGQLVAIRQVAEASAERAAARAEAARHAAERGRALAERQRRHADAFRRQTVLAAQAAERAGMRTRLEEAARADRVLPLIEAALTRADRAETTRRRSAEARAAAADLVPSAAPDDVLAKAERARRDEIAGLGRLREDAVRERQRTAEAAALARRAEGLAARETQLATAVAELPVLVQQGRAELEAVRLRAAGRPGAEAAVQEARRRVEAARRRHTVEAALDEAEVAHRAAIDHAQELRDRAQTLRQAQLDGMAAALAAELKRGAPCAVCGSADHPAPARPRAEAPTAEQVEAAHAAYELAQDDRERRGLLLAQLRTERDGLLEVTEEPLAELAAGLEGAEAGLAACTADAGLAERLQRQLDAAEQELAEARAEREAVLAELAETRARSAELIAEATLLRERLDLARGPDPTLEARIRRLAGEAELLNVAAEAVRQAETAADELLAARAAAEQAAVRAGFADVPEARRSALDEHSLTRLRERLRAQEAEEAAVRELLADPELTAAAALPAPALPALESALAVAQDACTVASAAADRARQRCTRIAELRASLEERVTAWRPAARRHEVAARLAALTSGNPAVNRLSTRLSAYVLAARLEQVVAAANERLARMSSGRYALVHTADRAAGDTRRAAGGLGLRIVDSWTGQERDPVTLSGGESFLAALSLALGLADVVTAESAAGTEINTLFVDEGFGTLDEDTLDEVMEVLDALRDGGRAVGIVSHVAELRTRIPARLHVTKTRTGSTVVISGRTVR
jgi:DNA repair protein SbcC/Rad50